MDKFDVIVVGAGSSGGVVAARLTENASRRVLLLEAGPDFPQEETVPPLFTFSGEHHWRCAGGIPEFDWDFVNSDGAGALGGRSLRVPRGRLVGGTSMVNATIAARGAVRFRSLGRDGKQRMGVEGSVAPVHRHRKRRQFRRRPNSWARRADRH